MNEPSHVATWNVMESNLKDWLASQRPKEIRRYMEDGKLVKVYESRPAAGDMNV